MKTQTDENGKPLTYWGGVENSKTPQEQILQEAREAAEKVYPKHDDLDSNWMLRGAFTYGYLAKAEKQKSEAVSFSLWQTTREGVDARANLIIDGTIRGKLFHGKLYDLFLKSKTK